jgi:hypothetical protein
MSHDDKSSLEKRLRDEAAISEGMAYLKALLLEAAEAVLPADKRADFWKRAFEAAKERADKAESAPSAERPTMTKVEVMGHPDQPVSARCILSGCQDFTPAASERAPLSPAYVKLMAEQIAEIAVTISGYDRPRANRLHAIAADVMKLATPSASGSRDDGLEDAAKYCLLSAELSERNGQRPLGAAQRAMVEVLRSMKSGGARQCGQCADWAMLHLEACRGRCRSASGDGSIKLNTDGCQHWRPMTIARTEQGSD